MANGLWAVFDYEVNQLGAMCELLRADTPILRVCSQELRNAVVESALVHTRILVQILLSEPMKDDFTVADLAPSFQSNNVNRLRDAYGKRDDEASPRCTINKRLAHPSKVRSDSHDYSSLLMSIVPIIRDLVGELEKHWPAQ